MSIRCLKRFVAAAVVGAVVCLFALASVSFAQGFGGLSQLLGGGSGRGRNSSQATATAVTVQRGVAAFVVEFPEPIEAVAAEPITRQACDTLPRTRK